MRRWWLSLPERLLAVLPNGAGYPLAGQALSGTALAPYIATWLASHHGLAYVGYYLSATALLTLIGLFLVQETKDQALI